MKRHLQLLLLIMIPSLMSFLPSSWNVEHKEQYTVYFDSTDFMERNSYLKLIDEGMKEVVEFTGHKYKRKFAVYIHPDRNSLDHQWQHDWQDPSFKSECWMVASGTGDKLDMIAPSKWDTLSCEHHYADSLSTQQLITHELMHVWHGQHNTDSVFNDLKNLDWLVEGVAVVASGQMNKQRIAAIYKICTEKNAPIHLSEFWKGKDKYAQAGSLVLYIDKHYGRKVLLSLLSMHSDKEVLGALHATENSLIKSWNAFVLKK